MYKRGFDIKKITYFSWKNTDMLLMAKKKNCKIYSIISICKYYLHMQTHRLMKFCINKQSIWLKVM